MVILSDDELIGLQIMALLRSGELPMLHNCDVDYASACNTRCKHRDRLNCDMNDDVDPVFPLSEFGDTSLSSCPMHYISPAIRQFVEEYNHFIEWGNLPHLDDLSGRWQTASIFYKSYLNTIEGVIMEREMKKRKSNKNI